MKKLKETSKAELIRTSREISLNDEQLTMFNLIKAKLDTENLLIGDEHLLKLYVATLDLYSKKLILIQSGYDLQEFQSGVSQVSPHYTIMRNSLQDLMKLSSLLGLPTTTRVKLKLDVGTKVSDHELDDI